MKSAPCLISFAYGSSDPKIRAFFFWHLAFNLWTPCNHCAAARRILFWRRNNRQRPIRYSSGKANPAISLFWKRRRQMRKHNFNNRQILKVSLIDLVSFEHEGNEKVCCNLEHEYMMKKSAVRTSCFLFCIRISLSI